MTSRCWGGDVSQPIIPPRSESDELRTPLRWNPASIAIPQPPSQRRSYNILRHCLVAASIEGVRDAAVPLTFLVHASNLLLNAYIAREIGSLAAALEVWTGSYSPPASARTLCLFEPRCAELARGWGSSSIVGERRKRSAHQSAGKSTLRLRNPD